MTDDLRLLVNLLRHEVAMVAFVEEQDRSLRLQHGAMDQIAFGVVNFGAGAVEDGAVAVFQIAHRIGEGRKRDRIGTDKHRIVAETDRERRAPARADQQVFLAGKQKRQRERAAQPRQRRRDRVNGRKAAL